MSCTVFALICTVVVLNFFFVKCVCVYVWGGEMWWFVICVCVCVCVGGGVCNMWVCVYVWVL